MEYQVGDKVLIKSIDWYYKNKDKDGDVPCGEFYFVSNMTVFCGKILTIDVVFEDGTYLMKEDTYGFIFEDEMIEGFAKAEMPLNIDDFQDDNEMGDVIDERVHRLKGDECQINLPEGYIFKDENDNEILTNKIILEKKKKEYPKTYDECCDILQYNKYLKVYPPFNADIPNYDALHLFDLLEALRKLLICRDAYWKIAGENMGLGKPWEPDYTKDRYIICRFKDKILRGHRISGVIEHFILEFPTEEMRDAFKENFDTDIEFCKEFL